MVISGRSSTVMYRNSEWCPIQNSPITAKLSAKLKMLGSAERSCFPASSIPGTRISITSRVIAIAKMASLKNRTRSYSRWPARASRPSPGRGRGSGCAVSPSPPAPPGVSPGLPSPAICLTPPMTV